MSVHRHESPIEAKMFLAVQDEIKRCGLPCQATTQARIGPYRVDILAEMDGKYLVVECDGAAYHAATKDQIERDKRRDRFFAAQNISVMRFTGAEINRCARACAAEVGAWIESAPSVRKAAIMKNWERGKLTRLEACRLIRRMGLVSA